MPRKGGVKENLKHFKAGEDPRRNLEGRPKKIPELDALLADVLGSDDENESPAKQILVALINKARNGDVRAAEVLLDRTYGKAKQPTDITTNGKEITGPPLTDDQFNKLVETLNGTKAG